MTRCAPASTVSDAVELTPLFVAVIVWLPPPVAEQTLPLQDPSGAIEKLVPAVTSPSEFPPASKPCAVYDCEPPDAIVALPGNTRCDPAPCSPTPSTTPSHSSHHSSPSPCADQPSSPNTSHPSTNHPARSRTSSRPSHHPKRSRTDPDPQPYTTANHPT